MGKTEVKIAGAIINQINGNHNFIIEEKYGPRSFLMVTDRFIGEYILAAFEERKVQPPIADVSICIKNILETFGLTLLEAQFSDLRNNVFSAILSVGSQVIDASPGVALALALRCNAPIFVSEEVIRKASGKEAVSGIELYFQAAEKQNAPKNNPIKALEKTLAEAIKYEEYEKCARIRDQIANLKKDKKA